MKTLLKKIFSRKASQAETFTFFSQLGRAVAPPRDIEGYSTEGYAKCVVVFRCVNLIAGAIASYPWVMYEKKGDRKEQVYDHPFLDLLQNPNPIQSREMFFTYAAAFYAIAGNCYIEQVNSTPSNNPNNAPDEMWVLFPQWMKVIPGATNVPAGYEHKVGTNIKRWEVDFVSGASNILHVKTFNPLNLWYGMSPIEPARYEVDQYNEGNVWNLSLLKNSARPSGAMVYKPERGDGKLLKEQREQLKNDIREIYSGAGRAGLPMLLDGGLDWKEMGLNLKEMDFANNKHITAKDIALAFGVPSQLVGIKDSQTFANYEQAKEAFHIDTALPIGRTFRGQLNKQILPKYGNPNLYIDIDEDEIPALEPMRRRKWDKVNSSTFLTVDEKREAVAYSPYEPTGEPGGAILVNASLMPLEFVTSEPETEPLDDVDDITESDNPDDDDKKQLPTQPTEIKQFNIENEKAKRKIFNAILRKRMKFEKRFTVQIAAFFRKQGSEMSSSLDGVSNELAPFVAQNVIEDMSDQLLKIMKVNIRAIAESFGEDVLAIAKECPQHYDIKQEDFLAGPRGKFHSAMDAFVEEEAASQVVYINRTTRKKVMKAIRDAIAEAIEEGAAGEVALGKKIQKTYSGFTQARSRTIARTEVHTASNTASREAAKSLEIPNLVKEWLSDMQDTARGLGVNDSTNHYIMNNEKVPIDEKFLVPSEDGDDEMDGPGDNSAPADQRINCKCTLIYSAPKGGAK